ncbi:MAG: CotH kinase family protein [Bacteroidia bacterium]
MKPRSLFFLLFLFNCIYFRAANGQIVINEYSPSNITTISNNGEYDDWIELYNAGASTVNLNNYDLTDDSTNLHLFTFPSCTLNAGGRILVFASGTLNTDRVDHWETAVQSGTTWKYYYGSTPADTNWRNNSFNDASWSSGPGGIGFGDGDDATTIPQGTTVLMRKSFTIADTSQIVKAIFNIDYDDGFVAYLNGVEIARANIGLAGIRPGYADLAILAHEAQMYQGFKPDSFFVDRNVFRSAVRQGTNVLAVEVHNQTLTSADLSAIPFLSFGMRNPGTFYSPTPGWFGTPAPEYFTANFKLSRNGEVIYLYDAADVLLDRQEYTLMSNDNSRGRVPDGSSNWCTIATPTPGTSNNSSTCYLGYALAPVFSVSAGFYSSPRFVTLTAPGGGIIRYTTNGDEPTASSTPYLSPILVTSTTTIRAKTFLNNYLPSPVVSNTYFINESVHLSVFSITTDSLNLWDYNTGIYVMGPGADSIYPYKGANFWQDWLKDASIEYYDKDKNKIFSINCAISIYGNYSRANPQKSFEIHVADRYGNGDIFYPLIPDKPQITKTNDFVLRNSGTDYNVVHFRDAFMERVMKNTNSGYIAAEPAVVFLNGNFWGVYTIHENHDHHWMENNYGYKETEIDYMKEYGSTVEVKAGTSDFFWSTYNYALSQDPSQPSFYQYLDSTWDLKNVYDYFSAETYYVNRDWIGDWTNNIKYWRPIGGKMRYLLYDTDFGCGLEGLYTDSMLHMATHPSAFSYTSNLFNAFLANPQFKKEFINRYADLINTTFIPSTMLGIMHQFQDSMTYDMPQHFAKWGSNMTQWQQHINSMTGFINNRPSVARDHIQGEFGLAGQVTLTLNVSPAGAGRIQISTITPGSLPWSGVYFHGNPVTITAIPNPGYTFNHWHSDSVITTNDFNQSTTYDFSSSDHITAYFTGSAVTPQIVVSELNYHASSTMDAGDWLELHNYGSQSIDISGWKLRDENDYNTFEFPVNTVIPANGYLVVAHSFEKFRTIYPTVTNVIGDIGFNFSNGGGQIRLFKYDETGYLSFYYATATPWPSLPDGQGYTCELTSNTADPNDGASWFAGCLGGSPGRAYSGVLAGNTSVSGSTTFCVGGSIALAVPYTAGYSYQWQRNGIDIPGANDTLYTSGLAGDYTVRVSANGCISTTPIVTVTTVTQGVAPVITNASRCGEGVVQLSATAPDSIYWFDAPGGNIIGTGPTFNTPYLLADSTFYAQTSLTCPSSVVSATAHVLAVTDTPVCSDFNRCGPGNVILFATDTATINWYNAPTAGAQIYSGNTFVTGYIPHDTTFYMQAGILCPSIRVPVNVTITSSPPPVVTNASHCGPGSGILTAFSLAPVFWYDSLTGGSQIGSGINFITPFVTETATYYAESNSGCASERVPVTFTIFDIPAPPVTSDSSRCGPGSVPLYAVSGVQVYWYDAPTGGNLLTTGSLLNTPNISSATTFYAESNFICSSTRTPAVADVLPLPYVYLGNDTSAEIGDSILLSADPGHLSYLWSNGDTTQTSWVHTANDYWVIVSDANGCSNSDTVTVTFYVGIEDPEFSNEVVTVYPNPSSEIISVLLHADQRANAILQLADLSGKIIFENQITLQSGNNKQILDLRSFAKGIYLLNVISEKKVETVRVVVH